MAPSEGCTDTPSSWPRPAVSFVARRRSDARVAVFSY